MEGIDTTKTIVATKDIHDIVQDSSGVDYRYSEWYVDDDEERRRNELVNKEGLMQEETSSAHQYGNARDRSEGGVPP